MITPGATPKLTISLNESNCLPIDEVAFNKRATNPSRKSIKAAMIIHIAAQVSFSGMLKLLLNSSFT